MKLSDLAQQQRNIFAMFVGRSGSGKSVATASFPRPMKMFDFDFRAEGVLGAVGKCYQSIDNIEVERFDTQGMSGFTKLDEQLRILEDLRKSGIFPYKLVTLDSLSNLCRIAMAFSNAAAKGGQKLVSGKLEIRLSDPSDYKIEASLVHQTFDFLRKLPCHVICSAHLVDKYSKPSDNPYGDKVRSGEKLTITDKLGENVLTYFNDVYRFDREEVNGAMRYTVEFATDLAKNSLGIGPGAYDISNTSFYELYTLLKENPTLNPQQIKELKEKK